MPHLRVRTADCTRAIAPTRRASRLSPRLTHAMRVRRTRRLEGLKKWVASDVVSLKARLGELEASEQQMEEVLKAVEAA